METKKKLRTEYFRTNRWVKQLRHDFGEEEFDKYYRNVHRWLNSLYFGQYFEVKKICRNNPELHDMFLACCDIYYNMDYWVNIEYDETKDTVSVNRPSLPGYTKTDHYWPPDVYSQIVKSPKIWGIDADDI